MASVAASCGTPKASESCTRHCTLTRTRLEYHIEFRNTDVSEKGLCIPSGQSIGDADLMPYLQVTRAPTHLQTYSALACHRTMSDCMASLFTFRVNTAKGCIAGQGQRLHDR